MRRRSFLTTLGAAAFAAGAAPTLGARRALAAPDRIAPLTFDSTASLLAADRTELTDESVVAVWAEDTAENVDEDDDGDAVSYDESTSIPLVAADDGVVGFGAPIVQNDTDFLTGNEEFVLNVLDAEVGAGSDDAPATVLFDYGHDQYYGPWLFEAFIDYAEENGYAFEWSDDLTADYADADAAVITSPASEFSAEELDALSTFVADGGSLLLFHQSDFGDYDATTNLDAIAEELGLAFRFNDDQVVDETNNAGIYFVPQTTAFNTRFDYFADREGLGFELDPDETYTVEVVDVTDGDTVDVRFEGGQEESVRVLGIDTPEKPRNRAAERAEEWEGIESYEYLGEWGDRATAFARDELTGETLNLRFDANESVRDAYGRLLGYVFYDADGTGSRDALYNLRAVEEGYGRLYDSGFENHDSFLDAELAARDARKNVWSESDPENSAEIRNGPVEAIFAPRAASVRTTEGALDEKRVPVFAAPTATQEHAEVEYDEIPLVGVDGLARVAVVGSPLVDESYEAAEGYPVDTSGYGNFAFLTSLIDRLSEREGDVLIDGGHGQFGVDYALSAEDAAYYQRYLEGVGIGFEGVNDITRERLDRGRALLVTSPVGEYTGEELGALRSFVADGGAVVLLGGDVPAAARENLNAVAEALCTDLRVSGDAVVDDASNLDGDASVPVTANFDRWFRLFDGYESGANYKGARGGPGRPGCRGRSDGGDDGTRTAEGKPKGKR